MKLNTPSKRYFLLGFAFFLSLPCMILLAGCGKLHMIPQAGAQPAPKGLSAIKAELNKVHPNEMGYIPILMYHSIGDSARPGHVRYDIHGWNISPNTFLHQLKLMYAAGWYPVDVDDILTSKINVPAGKTPVAITFDDSRGSQFHYLTNGKIDPNCAVGILLRFHKTHPDWPLRATFYVLPDSSFNPEPFHQHQYVTSKLQFLLKNGFQIGNHTTTHRPLAFMRAAIIQWELAYNIRYMRKRAPNIVEDSLALPYGSYPRNKMDIPFLLHGENDGVTYNNRSVMLAAGTPNPPFISKKFNKLRIMRMGAMPGYIEGWIKKLARNKPYPRFVSDGDPNIVTVPKKYANGVNLKALNGAYLYEYGSSGS